MGELFDELRAPVGIAPFGMPVTIADFNRWWRGRGIPGMRNGIDLLLREAGVEVPEELLRRNLGLSLSDQYWIRPDKSGLEWAEVNFFNNDFDDIDARTAPYALDPNVHARPENTSDGNLEKIWVVRDGVRMLRKGGLHNNQEPYNEVVATALHRRILPQGDYVEYELEETGLSAKNWVHLSNITTTPGFCDELISIYLATGLTRGETDPDEDEFLNIEKRPLKELVSMAMRGEICDSKTLIGLLMADKYLRGEA
jgi:hypothetical protein